MVCCNCKEITVDYPNILCDECSNASTFEAKGTKLYRLGQFEDMIYSTIALLHQEAARIMLSIHQKEEK